jgi:hypothetical protein
VFRMPTIDEEFLGAMKFIDTSVKQNKPFFVWLECTCLRI